MGAGFSASLDWARWLDMLSFHASLDAYARRVAPFLSGRHCRFIIIGLRELRRHREGASPGRRRYIDTAAARLLTAIASTSRDSYADANYHHREIEGDTAALRIARCADATGSPSRHYFGTRSIFARAFTLASFSLRTHDAAMPAQPTA